MVWVTGFDPAASCTRNTRSTKLSYTQMKLVRREKYITASNLAFSSRLCSHHHVLVVPPIRKVVGMTGF